jgi:ABC-type phosphate/phosphonate transport system substrate-binding protein
MPQAWRQKEKERLQQEQEEALRQMLKNTNEEERDRILADFHDHTRRLERRHDDQKQQQQDKLKAKLAARKRLDQQLDRDKAVNRELDHITKEHVSLGF